MLKKFRRIANILSRLFVRLAHVFEHLTCDDVPSVVSDDDDDYDQAFYGRDEDSIEPPDLDSLLSDDEEVL